MLAKKFESLLNGGAAVAGVEGLRREIAALNAEMDNYRRELGEMPTRRAALVLADDHAALDNAEARERVLYRLLEKGEMQVAALEGKLSEQRARVIKPRLEHHMAMLVAAASAVETAVAAAIEANSAARRAQDAAYSDVGIDSANMFLPRVDFVGLVEGDFLERWRGHVKFQIETIGRKQNMAR